MTIEAQLPGGTTLQFPDGTPDAVVQGAVKQHLSQQPDGGTAQTPESKLGLTPAPPEAPPPPTIGDITASHPGETDVPQWSNAAPGRIASAAVEGYRSSTPDVTPGLVMSGFNSGLANLVGAAGGIFRGGQQAVAELAPNISLPSLPPGVSIPLGGGRQLSGELTPGSLGREIAALPEAFPEGAQSIRAPGRPPIPGAEWQIPRTQQSVPFMYGPRVPQNQLMPRFVPELYGEGTPQNPLGSQTLLQQVTDAIQRADRDQSAAPPGAPAASPPPAAPPPAFVPPGTSAYPPGTPRAIEAGPRRGDVLAYGTPTDGGGAAMPPQNGLAPGRPGNPPAAPPPAAPAVPPDPAIMSQADMRARGHGYFNAADQAASQGAMLPDTNAAAVRKLFGDFIPGDPEAARISAGEPAMQAAKNVDATGPMSYDTAMRIDRDLTSRMRGASGTDAHDLSQLQQSLRDQMDQVPDLDNLRPGRQAWMQSIKQGQMEDINAGAALKNDPAAADAYVRQRAAALLKNDNAMRYWNPEEQAQLTQVAKSGDIGTLGRLSVSLIKPITRVALGAMGHSIAGPMGAIVGSEIGGDVGATQAGRLRSYLSKTTLDPVMEQITRGVPPPNRLAPGGPRNPPMEPSFDPSVLSATLAQLARSRARQASWQAESPP